MIVVICRSAFLASSIAGMIPTEQVVWTSKNSSHEDTMQWLASLLCEQNIGLVIYEPSFFVDPSPFRKKSPATSFIVLTSPGEETTGTEALACGAAALLAKPVDVNAVHGVFRLVST